jgi:two-component system, cell cycle response regulator
MNAVRVLIADDDLTSRSLLRQVLGKWGYDVIVAADGVEAWERLQEADPPRLAVLDWMMPGLDGVEVCRRIRQLDTSSPPYLILLTARGGKGDLVTGLEAGADDYVGKPFDGAELRARLEVGRRYLELNAKLLEVQQALEIQAMTDVLTGALNRRAILDALAQEMARAERDGTTVGVGMVDVDHFKLINDTWGHAVGDRVLQELVRCSAAAMRPYDAFGRFGGEEFLAVISGGSLPLTRRVLERIRRAIAGIDVCAEGHKVVVTASIGGVVGRGKSLDVLIRSADDALYQAKAEGRDRLVMAEGAGRRCEVAARPS